MHKAQKKFIINNSKNRDYYAERHKREKREEKTSYYTGGEEGEANKLISS